MAPLRRRVAAAALLSVISVTVGCSSSTSGRATSSSTTQRPAPSLTVDGSDPACDWQPSTDPDLNPKPALAPTTTGTPTTSSEGGPDAGADGGDDPGPVTLYFLAPDLASAKATAARWQDIDVSTPDVLDEGPPPWQLDSLLVITGAATAAGVEAMGQPTAFTCLAQVLEQVRPEVVRALAALAPARFGEVADQWDRYGVDWAGNGGDRGEGVGRLAAFMARAQATNRQVFVVLSA